MNCMLCQNTSIPISLSDSTIQILEIIMLLVYAAIVWYLVKIKHWKTLRNMGITLVGVVLFELMIDPLVINARMSDWTFYYRDLSFVITLGWVVIVSVVISLVDFTFKQASEFRKFWYYLCLIDVITLPVEIFLVQSGVRVYSESLINGSFGALIPFTMVPVEVAFAIPMFFALVIAFTKYWEGLCDARR